MNLEKVFRQKDAHKRLQEKEDVTHPVTDGQMELGEHDRTVSEILRDKKEQDQFLNRFCAAKDPDMTKDIAEVIANNAEFTPEQDKFLEKMRGEYNMRTAEVEKVQEILPEYIGRIADVDPRIKELVGKIGAERAAELLGKEFGTLSLSDAAKFRKVVKEMRGLHDIQSNELTAHMMRNVESSLSKYGISEEKYWEATRDGVTGTTKDNLDRLAYEQLGIFRKIADNVTGGSISHRRGRDMFKNFADQSAVIEEADKHMKAIGKVLRGTLEDGAVKQAIVRAMKEGGDVHEKKAVDNISTIDQYSAVKQDLASVQPRWEAYRDSEMKRLKIKSLSSDPKALDGMKERFAQQEFQKRQDYKPSPIFAALIALITGSSFSKDDIKNSLA